MLPTLFWQPGRGCLSTSIASRGSGFKSLQLRIAFACQDTNWPYDFQERCGQLISQWGGVLEAADVPPTMIVSAAGMSAPVLATDRTARPPLVPIVTADLLPHWARATYWVLLIRVLAAQVDEAAPQPLGTS